MNRETLEQQMLYYGKVVRASEQDAVRRVTFTPGSAQPAVARYVRRIGRPRNEWAVMLQREAWKMHPRAEELVHDGASWRTEVRKHCC